MTSDTMNLPISQLTDDNLDTLAQYELCKALWGIHDLMYERVALSTPENSKLSDVAIKARNLVTDCGFNGTTNICMVGATGYRQDISESGTFYLMSEKLLLVKVVVETDTMTISVWAFRGIFDKLVKALAKLSVPVGPSIHWIYGKHGETLTQRLPFIPLVEGAYPWMQTSFEDYVDSFLKSTANVLILIGPPGTGKTSFIRNMIHRSQASALLTYDVQKMNDDQMFVQFMEGSNRFLIIEDCDTLIHSRESGNTMMHKFLNVSDGLVSSTRKKMIFTTNLPSIRDVDPALTRPGRCFDVMEFRALNRQEASVVAENAGLELEDGNEFTLAEVLNPINKQKVNDRPTRSVGFV